jgi:hypothetical protein
MTTTLPFDLKKSYLSLKAHENMIGYASFGIRLDGGQSREGVIKIAAQRLPYGGGQYTLTVLVDTEGQPAVKAQLDALVQNLCADLFRPHLGQGFERLVTMPLDAFALHPGWLITELTFHFRRTDERDSVMLEEKLLPALTSVLPITIDSVEWWPVGRTQPAPPAAASPEAGSLKSFFTRWFGAG